MGQSGFKILIKSHVIGSDDVVGPNAFRHINQISLLVRGKTNVNATSASLELLFAWEAFSWGIWTLFIRREQWTVTVELNWASKNTKGTNLGLAFISKVERGGDLSIISNKSFAGKHIDNSNSIAECMVVKMCWQSSMDQEASHDV